MDRQLKTKRICSVALVVALVAGFVAAYIAYGPAMLSFIRDEAAFKAWLNSFGSFGGAAAFVAIRAFQTVIKIIPAEPLEIASGYIFGTFGGLALCMLGTAIGSVVILLLTRKLGMKMLELFVPASKLQSYSFLQNEKRLGVTLFMIYIIPSTPKDLITYFAGLTKMKIWKFMLITSIARIPSIITSTWCGSQLEANNITNAIVIFVLTAVVGVAGTLIYRAYEKKHPHGENENTLARAA